MAFIGLAFTLSAQTLWADSNLKVSEIIRQDLRFCESTYPYDGGILVANFGSGQLDPLNAEGKGYINWYKNGKVSTLIPADGSLSAPKGMLVKDGYLYVCDVNRIVVFSLKERTARPRTISLPEGNLFVNDLVEWNGSLYASVTNTDRIFRLDISDPMNPGTPQEHLERISEDDILRTIAFFRYINPEATIRLGAGRALLTNDGEPAFCSGASATITG